MPRHRVTKPSLVDGKAKLDVIEEEREEDNLDNVFIEGNVSSSSTSSEAGICDTYIPDPIGFILENRTESAVLMASTLISNLVTNSERARESSKRRRKKKVLAARDEAQDANGGHMSTQWKSETQQQLYSLKLLQALCQVRVSSSPSAPRRVRAMREAADRVLAMEGSDREVMLVVVVVRSSLAAKSAYLCFLVWDLRVVRINRNATLTPNGVHHFYTQA
ncbi:hypothetical protein U1Q18_010843 [Sarracenia purpurea var. burkii]